MTIAQTVVLMVACVVLLVLVAVLVPMARDVVRFLRHRG